MLRIHTIVGLLIMISFILSLSCGCSNEKTEDEIYSPDIREVLISKLKKDRFNIEINEKLWRIDTRNFEFDSVLHYALPCYSHSLETSDKDLQMSSGIFISQAYLLKSKVDSMFMYLNPIAPLVEKTDKIKMKIIYNNTLGIYYMGFSMDINKAIEYLQKSLSYSMDEENIDSYSAVMANIVYAYFLRNDPEGLSYALKICELGEKYEDDYVSYLGAFSAAHMYYLSGNYETALEYMKRTEYLKDKIGTKNYTTYPLYAEILFALGGKENMRLGAEYIETALDHVDYMDNANQIYTYLIYGKYLRKEGKYNEAIAALEKGISKTYSYRNFSMYTNMFMALSDIYRELGMNSKAEQSAIKYKNTRDSLFNVDNERMFNNLRFRFESERLNNIIQSQQLVILERKRQQDVMILIIVTVVALLGMTYIMYRKKNSMYKKLAAQYDNFKLRQEVSSSQSMENAKGDKTGKYRELYENLTRLVEEEKIYRRNDISMDMLASRLSTNKSYLSRMFAYYNTSFNAFVNSHRIKECTTILSDTSDDSNLKTLADRLGFNSMSSFYRAFLNETGVPPAQYRKYKHSLKKH